MAMPRIKYTPGQMFGRLEFLFETPTLGVHRKGVFKCYCGFLFETSLINVRREETRSCGCLRIPKGAISHGLSRTRIYNIYMLMMDRCYNEKSKHYKNYGERGIAICIEWKDSLKSFVEWSKSNGYSEHLTIDRINNNEGYSPENCRWTTALQQSRNKRSTILTAEKAKDIRLLLNDYPEIKHEYIAKIYGISASHLSNIKNNRVWKSIN